MRLLWAPSLRSVVFATFVQSICTEYLCPFHVSDILYKVLRTESISYSGHAYYCFPNNTSYPLGVGILSFSSRSHVAHWLHVCYAAHRRLYATLLLQKHSLLRTLTYFSSALRSYNFIVFSPLKLLPSCLLQHDYPWRIAFLSVFINNGVIQTLEYGPRFQTMPSKVHEFHFPWFVDTIRMYPQLLTEKESCILVSHKQHALFSLTRCQQILIPMMEYHGALALYINQERARRASFTRG